MKKDTSELDRMFEERTWLSLRRPLLRADAIAGAAYSSAELDVFEKDDRLVITIDLLGMQPIKRVEIQPW